MYIKILAYSLVAALLMTGTAAQVSSISGQGAQSPALAVTSAATLTEAEATAIALEHAKLTEADITELRVRMDRDDHRHHWEVHWRSGDWGYEYDIDANTGAILDWEREYAPTPKADAQPTETPASEAPKTESVYLTEAEATAIALEHAGFTADQVSFLEKDD